MLAAAVMSVPLVAAGCKGIGALGTPPKPRPDVAVLQDAISAEEVMIARYRSAISGSAGLAPTLTPLLDQHLAHLATLRSRLIVPAGRPATLRPTKPSSAPTQVPATPAAALSVLETAESNAARSLVSRLDVVGPSLAQLLASIAASEASHALLLRNHGGAQ
jgi:hypothetical protein